MLVGSYTQTSDSNIAMKRLSKLHINRAKRGMSGCGDCISYDPTGVCLDVDLSDCTGTGQEPVPTVTTNPTTVYPAAVNPNATPWSSIAAAISSIGASAAKAFGATQVQCSVGTTLIGNQCLPTTAVNALNAQAAASSGVLALSSVSSYLPLLLIGGVVLFFMSSASSRH